MMSSSLSEKPNSPNKDKIDVNFGNEQKIQKTRLRKTLDLQVSLRDVLPPNHLARFAVDIRPLAKVTL
jgi:hypothetical protein